jgi:hypothetical protein
MVPRARWLPSALALAILSACPPFRLSAQPTPAAKDTTTHKPARLFRAKDPVVMWLEADFKTVFKDRDSLSTKRYPAKLRYLGEKGDTLSLDVQLSTRGHYRLKAATCAFPPLRVHFDREKSKGTLFGGEGALKLSTHCQKGENYAQNVYVEYAIYGMYNALTPVGLKARLATITWIDPNDPKFTITRPGFWLQDDNDLAKELKGKVVMQKGGAATEMDPQQMAITDVFQYMIANTDYSLSYLHNYRIFVTDTSMAFFPMAYDFDWSGLVDAPYAVPDYRLPIKRVTERLYRGGCHPPELLAGVVARFKEKKDAIYGSLREIKELDPKRLKTATDFLDEFYKMIDDAGMVRREFGRVCS